MILHRLVDGLRKQDWFTVVVEVGIVVLGVFLGIEVANWNEDRQNRASAQSYLARLENDLGAQLYMWENAHVYFAQTSRHAQAALDARVRPAGELDQQFLIDLYQASNERWLSDRRSTYDELVATGRIDDLDNPGLREILSTSYNISARWQMVLEGRTEYRAVARQLMDHRVQQAIARACGDLYVENELGVIGLSLPTTCEIDLPASLVTGEIMRLHANEELLRHLRFQATTLRGRLFVIEAAIDSTRTTLEAVRHARRASG